ncbi:phage terminase small subunit [Agaricicola taiwanensis]|uniref:Phage terminase small subunit n=1 Tax=Agaricicola taiwanensis TaxID=591372 RepID=A0A8J2YN90_9RHOB|nr:terminase small subunit [Agaricicola taiwanensis]GGE55648.1 phage terminase small subunit [Agaricicola taiwanensis]
MPPLDHPRHERFAQLVALGKPVVQAYGDAGYRPDTSNSSKLKAREEVGARIAELTAEGAARAEVDITRVLTELMRLATSDLRQAFDAEGNLKDPSQWDDDFAASIASIEVVSRAAKADESGKRGVEYVHKIKTWDKISALDKIARHLGLYNDSLNLNVTDDLAARLARAKARAGGPG